MTRLLGSVTTTYLQFDDVNGSHAGRITRMTKNQDWTAEAESERPKNATVRKSEVLAAHCIGLSLQEARKLVEEAGHKFRDTAYPFNFQPNRITAVVVDGVVESAANG
jgi:hypothetical protein